MNEMTKAVWVYASVNKREEKEEEEEEEETVQISKGSSTTPNN